MLWLYGPKNSCTRLGLIFCSAAYWFTGKRVDFWARCMFGWAAQVLALSFITMMNGISLICLIIVCSRNNDEMEGRKRVHIFRGDVSLTGLCGRPTQSQLATHRSSTVGVFGGGADSQALGEGGKKTFLGPGGNVNSAANRETADVIQSELRAGNHLWRSWAKGEWFVRLLYF